MPNIPNKEDELQIVKCFGDAQVYDGGWHAEYDGKWIDITNEVYNVKRLMEAREKSIREEAEKQGMVNGLRQAYELVNDVRYRKQSIDGVFRQLIEECSQLEAELEIAKLDAVTNTQVNKGGE